MRNFKSIALSVFLLFMFHSCYLIAQQDFRPGYIITNSNDTIKGLLLYKDFNTSRTCKFKEVTYATASDYTPSEIHAFRFDDGKYFVSKETPNDTGNRLLFLEFLIKGKANIYFMRDESEHYYIETAKQRLIELSEPEEYITTNDGIYAKPKKYTGKLLATLSDCPDVYSEIRQMDIDHSSLIKLAKHYHQKMCTSEQCIIFERTRKPVVTHFGIMAGISLNRFNFGNQMYTNYGKSSMLGFRFEFNNIFFRSEHTSLQIEMLLQNISSYNLHAFPGQEDYPIFYNGVWYTLSPAYNPISRVDFKAIALRFPLSYNYQFLTSKISAFAGLGIADMFIIRQNKDLWLSNFKFEIGQSIPKYHMGLLAKAGAKYKINNHHLLFAEMSYEFSQNVNVNEFFRLSDNSFSFTCGYSL